VVALKLRPDAVSEDPDRRSRFNREAKALASLSHPNIGTNYGFEDSVDTAALEWEIVPRDLKPAKIKLTAAWGHRR